MDVRGVWKQLVRIGEKEISSSFLPDVCCVYTVDSNIKYKRRFIDVLSEFSFIMIWHKLIVKFTCLKKRRAINCFLCSTESAFFASKECKDWDCI